MRYRKKPVEVEAIQYKGTLKSYEEIQNFFGMMFDVDRMLRIQIPTLEGVMSASKGDYIIKGVKGELYPCKPDIFEQTYEAVYSEAATPAEEWKPEDEKTWEDMPRMNVGKVVTVLLNKYD